MALFFRLSRTVYLSACLLWRHIRQSKQLDVQLLVRDKLLRIEGMRFGFCIQLHRCIFGAVTVWLGLPDKPFRGRELATNSRICVTKWVVGWHGKQACLCFGHSIENKMERITTTTVTCGIFHGHTECRIWAASIFFSILEFHMLQEHMLQDVNFCPHGYER